jgi:hypothetical protein
MTHELIVEIPFYDSRNRMIIAPEKTFNVVWNSIEAIDAVISALRSAEKGVYIGENKYGFNNLCDEQIEWIIGIKHVEHQAFIINDATMFELEELHSIVKDINIIETFKATAYKNKEFIGWPTEISNETVAALTHVNEMFNILQNTNSQEWFWEAHQKPSAIIAMYRMPSVLRLGRRTSRSIVIDESLKVLYYIANNIGRKIYEILEPLEIIFPSWNHDNKYDSWMPKKGNFYHTIKRGDILVHHMITTSIKRVIQDHYEWKDFIVVIKLMEQLGDFLPNCGSNLFYPQSDLDLACMRALCNVDDHWWIKVGVVYI